PVRTTPRGAKHSWKNVNLVFPGVN
ncbi:uncharacterized protein METZ01_LOCUS327821, partial [marine metagenome]